MQRKPDLGELARQMGKKHQRDKNKAGAECWSSLPSPACAESWVPFPALKKIKGELAEGGGEIQASPLVDAALKMTLQRLLKQTSSETGSVKQVRLTNCSLKPWMEMEARWHGQPWATYSSFPAVLGKILIAI